jgi:mRNA interferase MazF
VNGEYVPDAGDLVLLTSDLPAGGDPSDRRTALVLTARVYNDAARLAVVCPVTHTVKGYPFEVPLPHGLPVEGAVLADHVRSVDWRSCGAEYQGRAGTGVLDLVRGHLRALLNI